MTASFSFDAAFAREAHERLKGDRVRRVPTSQPINAASGGSAEYGRLPPSSVAPMPTRPATMGQRRGC